MSLLTLFKPCGVGNFEWLRVSDEPSGEAPAYAVGDAERLAAEASAGALVFIAPADKIGLRVAGFEAGEKKLLRQTLPYALEEELVDDVDELHFALGRVDDSTVDIAIVKRGILERWRSELAEQGLEVQQIVSELQLLPLEDNAWTVFVAGDHWLIRYGDSRGFAMEPAVAGVGLQLLLDEAEVLPERLLVFGDGVARESILSQLPDMLRGVVDWQTGDYWSMVSRGFTQFSEPINLLQGEYAVGLPWKKWWRVWKPTAVIVVAAIAINLVLKVVGLEVLDHQNLQLRRETERVYRSVIPRGAVLRPADQLRRKVVAMRGSGGASFVSLLDRVAGVLTKIDGLQLQSLNYNEKQSEIRLTILANGFNDVETARANLEKAGLSAQLTGSNAEGGKTRARLRVRG